MKVVEFVSVFFSLFGIAFSVVNYENDTPDLAASIYNSLCTVLLVACIYLRYQTQLRWMKSKSLLTNYDTLVNTGRWKEMVAEMGICLLAPYPFLNNIYVSEYYEDWKASVTYQANDYLLFCMFLRFYLPIRFILMITTFMNPRSQRICNMNGCEANYMFAIKALMKKIPYTVITISMSTSVVILGFCLRMFERGLSEASGQDFNNVLNSFWNVFVTMTTVGYGELYPKTGMGRFVGIIICMWGVFIVSFFVVTVNNMLNFTSNEDKAYQILMKLSFKEELKRRAVRVLGSAFR